MSRVKIARWLLEKLLGSFIVSAIFVWGHFVGINFSHYGIGTVYTIVTSVTLMVSILVNILVPGEIKIFNEIRLRIRKM